MNYLLTHTILNSAKRLPDKEAFKCGQQSLTYSEVATQMQQLARVLLELGVKKGDRVGIYLHRCLETAVAIYGVMHAGAIYVPIDPKSPADRSRFIIKDCGIKILITHPSQRRNVAAVRKEATELEIIIGLKEADQIKTISWQDLQEQVRTIDCPFPMLGQDPAYVIYTSGSTGTPKGIVHSHYSGLSYAKLVADLYQLKETDRIGNHAPIHFDISFLAYFSGPLVGASNVIFSDAYTVLPASLTSLMEKEQLTIWYSVPLALIQMVQNGLLEERDLSTLRWVLYAGEAFPPKYLRPLMLQWPHARVSNIYGPAETNQCTYYHLPAPPEGDEPVPIGTTWGDTESLIVDENDQEVIPGKRGELLIRSATMMKGYWQQPELTEKSLYRRERMLGLDEVFYRTGDLARLDENNVLQFLGRKDNQIKIRGYRVELDAIENLLVSHSAVSEAAVFAFREKDETMKILAAVILKEEDFEELALMNFLKQKLPFYSIPENISILPEFPRTGTGKINRPAIKELLCVNK